MKRNIKKFGLSFLTLLLFCSCTDNFLYNDKPPTEDGNYPSIIFKGEIIDNQFVHLFWKCNSPHIDGFIVERSVDGAFFKEIARVRYPKAEFSDSLMCLPENVTKLSYQITTISMKYKLTCGVVNAVRKMTWEDTTFMQLVPGKVSDLFLTPANKTLFCVREPAALKIIQFPEINTLFSYETPVFQNIFFSHNWLFFAILKSNGLIDFYENFTFRLMQRFQLPGPILRSNFIAISPDGKIIVYYGYSGNATSNENRGLVAFSVDEQKVISKFNVDDFSIGSGIFMPDSNYFACAVFDRLIIYKINDGSVVYSSNYHWNYITNIDFSPNYAFLVTGDDGGKIVIWDMKNFEVSRRMQATGIIHELHFSPTGDMLISRTRNYLQFWAVPSGYLLRTTQAFFDELDWNQSPRLTSFSADGKSVMMTNLKKCTFYKKSDSFIWQIE